MSTETEKDTRLFMDLQGGRVVCFEHLGGYGKHDVAAFPEGTSRMHGKTTWTTPLDVWVVMEKVDREAFVKEMAEYGSPGEVAKCDDCGFNPDEVKS
jgi:hypothetical protein